MNKKIFNKIFLFSFLRFVFFGFSCTFGFLLVGAGRNLSLLIYNYFGIVRPVCSTAVLSCSKAALYDCSLFIPTILGAVIMSLSLGYLVKEVTVKK